MKTCGKGNEPAAIYNPTQLTCDRMSEQNFHLLRWLVDYELRAAERYRRFVTLMLVASRNGCFYLKDILVKTKRESDRLFELDNEVAILMSETDLNGALTAVERYKSLFSEDVDLRFSVVSFPLDGVNCSDLMGKVFQRLDVAKALECGAVVSRG